MTRVMPREISVAPVAFSTAGLPAEQRVELWEDHNADALIGLRCRTLAPGALEATEINVQLPRVHLARVRGSSHVVERDVDLIRRRPSESVALFFSLAGDSFFYHDDGVRVVQPGQLLMCDADRPFMRGFSNGLEELVLKIPGTLFASQTGIERVTNPVVIDFSAGTNSHAHTLARRVGKAARAADWESADELVLLDLVSALANPRDRDLAAAHRAAAETFIEQNLFEPSLSAVQVATALGISSRHLSRVFSQASISFPRFVLSRRLEAARHLLEQPAPSMTISDVARHCGFGSTTRFSSAFTSYFGEHARDVRRRAVARRVISLP
jgi:AraC-like DNA-binding protein